ncbi:hypothetical protein LTR53_004154 [Teratosphaeriaceae sp. CCFEE 6253]|nr:hypothetical protein LTR53_004154 [Teratosphaeriaceae sp. CCFEE 6253]
MPSSSARTTSHERTLIRLWRETYYHLWHAQEPSTSDLLTRHFASTLDISVAELKKIYFDVRKDSLLPKAEVAEWANRSRELAKLRREENLAGAADCLYAVGTALKAVGREGEAKEWWGMSQEVKGWFRI